MAGQPCGETGRTPIIVARVGSQALHLPPRDGGTRLRHRTFAQQEQSDAAFLRQKRQPATCHQIQAARRAGNFQHHRTDMRASQNVGGGTQRLSGVRSAKQKEMPGIAAQFQKSGGRQGAIFQRFIIRPDPEEGFLPHGLNGKAGGEPASAPIAREHFVQSAPPETAAQHGIDRRQPKRNRRPVRGQAVMREKMAQIRQFFYFVHVMF